MSLVYREDKNHMKCPSMAWISRVMSHVSDIWGVVGPNKDNTP